MKDLFKKLFQPSNEESVSKGSERTTARVYWILQGELAVGPLPNSESMADWMTYGFKSVLTVCSEQEGSPPSELVDSVSWRRIPLVDSHYDVPMAGAELSKAVESAQELVKSAKPLYVHCVAGMERSPSVCVAYLCRYKGMPLWEALNWVKQSNPRTNIIDSQLNAIQEILL